MSKRKDYPLNVSLVHQNTDGPFWFAEGDSLENNIYTRTWSETLLSAAL